MPSVSSVRSASFAATSASSPTLRQGASGAAVRDLQNALRAAGHNISVDGQFGPQTWGRLNSGGAQGPGNNGGGVGGNSALANAARSVALGMGGYNSQGLCAKGVSTAIQRVYGIKVWGNGNDIDNNLPRDKFKQINISLSEALKIPGLILTWEETSTSAGSIYGHTAITLGDGRSSASDFIEGNTLAAEGGRQGLKIFAPI